MMDIDLGTAILALPLAEPSEMERIVRVMTQMQEGFNTLLDIMVQQKAEIVALQVEVRRIKARTDAPARPSIIKPGAIKWPN